MKNTDDHRWDLSESDKGYVPECDDAFDHKMEEWQARNWPDWLAKNLTFPFTVIRIRHQGPFQIISVRQQLLLAAARLHHTGASAHNAGVEQLHSARAFLTAQGD